MEVVWISVEALARRFFWPDWGPTFAFSRSSIFWHGKIADRQNA
jgi:hypothetical protein